jgi:HK97 family phage prohead protease
MNRERKYITGEVKQLGEGEAPGQIEGYAAVFNNVDRAGERILPGAFVNLAEFVQSGTLAVGHDWSNVGVATIDSAIQDERGLRIVATWLPTDEAQEVRKACTERLRRGKKVGMSIGYEVKADQFVDGIRELKSIELYEASLVMVPANPEASVLSAKGLKATSTFQDFPVVDVEWDKDGSEDRWRAYSGSEDEPSDTYRRRFFWYDAENADNFGSYKLPFVDIQDGKPVAVRGAITAAAAAIMGARGGVDIPETDMAAVKNHIARYYEKLDLTPPWENEKSARQDGFRLADHLSAAINVMTELADRLEGLASLRHASGKCISPSTRDAVKDLLALANRIQATHDDDTKFAESRELLAKLRQTYGG